MPPHSGDGLIDDIRFQGIAGLENLDIGVAERLVLGWVLVAEDYGCRSQAVAGGVAG